MPRIRTLSDQQLLEMTLALIHREGPDAATFSAVARICGLSASTLVQRFGSKTGLVQAALLHAWDRLDNQTAELAASNPRSPEGAISVLAGLSKGYGGDPAAYADGLLILREDLRDPVLRARGAKWSGELIAIINDCLKDLPNVPDNIGRLVTAQWQGAVLWWGFEPKGRVEDSVTEHLRGFLKLLMRRT